MILRSLAVEGWRCFANRLEIGPLAERLNVIHGPNGIGKSTLMWALVRGLFDNHAVSGQAYETLRPWGRTSPRGSRSSSSTTASVFGWPSSFSRSPSAELSRFEDGKFVRLAEGEAANSQVREMLGGVAAEARARPTCATGEWRKCSGLRRTG